MQLGNIEVLNPKSLGLHEEHGFTPWLLKNLDCLGEALGIDIAPENRCREVSVGRYIADITAEEAGTGRRIIIENQLRPSDHNHLGQLLTYAAGMEGAIIVWVCHELRDEHRRVLDWLNAQAKGVGFFGIEFEVIKIDDSKPAFRFVNVVRPAEWSDDEGDKSSGENGRFRPFFQALVDEMREQHRFTNARKAQDQRWCSFAAGHSGLLYSAVFAGDKSFRVELYVTTESTNLNKAIFDFLNQRNDEITKEIGHELVWERGEGRRFCRISISMPGTIDDIESWPTLKSWGAEWLLKFRSVFGKYLPEAVAEAKTMLEETKE